MPVTLPSGFNIAPALSPDRVVVSWPGIPTSGSWMFFGNVPLTTENFFATTTDPLNLNLSGRGSYGVASAAITAAASGGTILVPLIDGTSIMRSTWAGHGLSAPRPARSEPTSRRPSAPARAGASVAVTLARSRRPTTV
jgi:hypothetical protein